MTPLVGAAVVCFAVVVVPYRLEDGMKKGQDFSRRAWLLAGVASSILVLLITVGPLVHHYSYSDSERRCSNSMNDTRGLICVNGEIWDEVLREDETRWARITRYYSSGRIQRRADYRQAIWKPTFTCPIEYRVGEEADGGKWLCNLKRLTSREWNRNHDNCLVYSFGIGGKFGFESELITRSRAQGGECEVHMFDPDAGRWKRPALSALHVHSFGVAHEDMESGNFLSYYSLLTRLGHSQRTVNVLKIDVEGGERTALPDIMSLPGWQRPRQILVEVHFGNDIKPFHNMLLTLRKAGYVMFHTEENYYCDFCTEFSFLHLASRTTTGGNNAVAAITTNA